MASNPRVFLPGYTAAPTPLERYLPPLPAGVITTWLRANVADGAWVLDPFGTSPQVALEAASAGYKVAVAANNPIARFLLEGRASAPSADELRAALAELAASRRGDERLETSILDLYMTACPNCTARIPADAFIWERDSQIPHAKLINCKACGTSGEFPTDQADADRAAEYERGGLHISRALQRIAPPGDPDRVHAEEALQAYLPRAVQALFAIINRVDGMQVSEQQRMLIFALVLSACDRATSLWAHPSGRMRPKQLTAPPQFREYNLWHEMERSIDLWAQTEPATPLHIWPEKPVGAGISVYEGRLRDLADELNKARIQAVVTAFPRPNQAYWTLSALWAGWLWGREAIGPFALVLRRKRYDWAWHTEALHAALASLSNHLQPDTPMFGIVAESEPGFNGAVLAAANLADFRLNGIALRLDEAQFQLTWQKGLAAAKKSTENTVALRRSVRSLLNARGEPSHFLHLHAAGMAELSKREHLGGEAKEIAALTTETRQAFEVSLTLQGSFMRFGSSEQSLETGLWWLIDPSEARSPLADRIEIATVRYLLRRPGRSLAEIDRTLCEVFPGLLTPPISLVRNGLISYAEERDGAWHLTTADQPRARRKDLRDMRSALAGLGERLGYKVIKDDVVQWREGEAAPYTFHIIASAVLGEILLKSTADPARSFIVLPGRRAGLVLAKLVRDPRFQQAVDDGWRFIKFRHVRRLAENLSLTRESFAELLDLDPLTLEHLQAPLL
jgi:hypothetical protein